VADVVGNTLLFSRVQYSLLRNFLDRVFSRSFLFKVKQGVVFKVKLGVMFQAKPFQ